MKPFLILLLLSAAVVAAPPPADPDEVKIHHNAYFKPTYDRKFPPLTEAQAEELYHKLDQLPGHFVPGDKLDVRALCKCLIRRFRESGFPMSLAMESFMHPLHAEHVFLDAPVTQLGYKKMSDADLRKALPALSCDDLLRAIMDNSGLILIERKGMLFLAQVGSD